MSQIKAVIFDHDGVIIDNQAAQIQAWKTLFAERGERISDSYIKTNVRGRPTKHSLRDHYQGRLDDDKLQELADRKEALYLENFLGDFTSVPGIVEFMGRLKQAGLKVAIATSTRQKMLDISMRRLRLAPHVDAIVTVEDITNSKPHPEVYLKAAAKLGVKPHECIVFEDALSGVQSALAAGMKVVLVTTSHKPHEVPGITDAIANFTTLSAQDVLKLGDD